jgi:hypothetical protein
MFHANLWFLTDSSPYLMLLRPKALEREMGEWTRGEGDEISSNTLPSREQDFFLSLRVTQCACLPPVVAGRPSPQPPEGPV